MKAPKKITKSLAAAIDSVYARAIEAREAIEHRLASIPRQEAIVRQWQENLSAMAALNYPGHDLSSYPVQTRMQRELEKLERYRIELPERLKSYSTALQAIDRTIEEVHVAINCNPSSGLTEPWPVFPKLLRNNPWPSNWPPRPCEPESEDITTKSYFFDTNRALPPKRQSSPTSFSLEIANREIKFQVLYRDGVNEFTTTLKNFLNGRGSSRWPAIIEVIRCGIRWPQLDQYLNECKAPWLPEDFVDAEFGLRGTLARRDELAELMAQISPDAGRWYLSMQPSRYRVRELKNVDSSVLEELMAIGLVRWGANMSLKELLYEVPFSEIKSLFSLAGLSPPRGFGTAIERYGELVSIRGEDYLRRWVRSFTDPSDVIEVREIDGWDREERLGPRARANVLVSTLVLLHEGNRGAVQVLAWAQ